MVKLYKLNNTNFTWTDVSKGSSTYSALPTGDMWRFVQFNNFVLATNIDILFNDEVMQYLALRRLEPGHMYRMDRYDTQSHVPVDGTVEEQLAYCEANLLRVNAREATFTLSGGLRDPTI